MIKLAIIFTSGVAFSMIAVAVELIVLDDEWLLARWFILISVPFWMLLLTLTRHRAHGRHRKPKLADWPLQLDHRR